MGSANYAGVEANFRKGQGRDFTPWKWRFFTQMSIRNHVSGEANIKDGELMGGTREIPSTSLRAGSSRLKSFRITPVQRICST
jgi:hypothetical protein